MQVTTKIEQENSSKLGTMFSQRYQTCEGHLLNSHLLSFYLMHIYVSYITNHLYLISLISEQHTYSMCVQTDVVSIINIDYI